MFRREAVVPRFNRRRSLQAALAGTASLALGSRSLSAGERKRRRKSVILLWMAGGPSHIDTWDPKPGRPAENRGPFRTISTSVPGLFVGEHLPRQAAMMDRFTIVRSVDPRGSDHSPGKVMQTGNREASPRRNPKGDLFPAYGSVIARFLGAHEPGMPAYVSFNRDPNHIAGGGYLGMQYDPMNGHRAAGFPDYEGFGRLRERDAEATEALRFDPPEGVDAARIRARRTLLGRLDRFDSRVDRSGSMSALDQFNERAVEMVLGGRARRAFDLSLEPESTRRMYGGHLWSRQALAARRLVEAGTAFVTLDLTMGVNAGDWDSHGDQHVFGGIETGLKPLLPVFDHLVTTLVADLQSRGLLDDVLVLALGEFGRSPVLGTQAGFTGGRNHWPRVMSMCLAGGGLQHGRVVGASTTDGGEIATLPVTPADIAATIYAHVGLDPDTSYLDDRGRPRPIVAGSGRSIGDL